MKGVFCLIKQTALIVLILLGLSSSFAYSQPPQPLPPDVAQAMDHYYALQNKQDYVPLYRDLSSPRFTASDSFDNFKTAMERVMDECGPVEEREVTHVLSDTYHTDQDFSFYRMQFDVGRQKCQTVERIVTMRRNGIWEVDGYAIAKDQQALFAQGNLYNFEHANEPTEKTGLEDLSKIKGLQDSRTEYLNDEWKRKIDEFKNKNFGFLEAAITGNFEQAKAMMEEDSFTPYAGIIEDAITGEISKEAATTFFSAIRSVVIDNNIEEGIKRFEKVIELDPSYVETYIHLATLQVGMLKDVEAGIKTAEQGLQYHPDEARLMMLLVKFYKSSGDMTKADQYFEKAKSTNPALFRYESKPDKDGRLHTYHPNGQLAFEGWVENDAPTGPFKMYYEDGTLMIEGEYVNNQLEGEFKFYFPSGNLRRITVYQEGQEIEEKIFTDEGQVEYEKSVVK